MANPQRLRKVADQIRRELSDLVRTELKDPRIGMVTFTDVVVSPDFAHAKVYFTLLGSESDRVRTQEGLNSASGYLRSELGRRVRTHNTPELRFFYDESVERGANLSKLIDRAVGRQGGRTPGQD